MRPDHSGRRKVVVKVTFLPAGSVTFQPAITRFVMLGSQLRAVQLDGRTVLQVVYEGLTEASDDVTVSSRVTEALASEVRTSLSAETEALEIDSILHSRGQSSPGSASISSTT